MCKQKKFGCHCDLEPGQEHEGCVLDYGRREDCDNAMTLDKRENCEYWQPFKQTKAMLRTHIEKLEHTLRAYRSEMERAAIACAHGEARTAQEILNAALGL